MLVGFSLRPDGFAGRDGRLGLLELGAQVGIVQAKQDVVGFYLLARFKIDLHHARSSFEPIAISWTARIDPTADSKSGSGTIRDLHNLPFDALCRGLLSRRIDRHLG